MGKAGALLLLLLVAFLLANCGRGGEAAHRGATERSGVKSVVHWFDPAKQTLRLVWQVADGKPLGTLEAARQEVERTGGKVVFGMNAGIYNPGQIPAGLHVQEGRELRPLNTAAGEGNFYLKPNGVFALVDGKAVVAETGVWQGLKLKPELATQSGPLLLDHGKLHPAFKAGSENKLVRNGVGVTKDGRVVLAMSLEPVNLYDFALLFRDNLGCESALYLDGVISQVLAPAEGRNPEGGEFAGMLMVQEKAGR